MGCNVADAELAEFAVGEMCTDRRRAIGRHLTECTACQRRLEALRKVDATLRVLPRMEPSARAILNTRRLLAREVRRGDAPEIMTLDDVAEFLRIRIDDLEDIAEELPAFELAGEIRVRRSMLLEWIEQREQRYMLRNAECDVARIIAGAFGKGVA